MSIKHIALMLGALILFGGGVGGLGITQAQGEDAGQTEETPIPDTPIPPVPIIDYFEPGRVTTGQSNMITVRGQNFTENASVRIAGYGVVSTAFISQNVLTATLPENVPPGMYYLTVLTTNGESAFSASMLTVLFPPAPPPPPTQIPPPPEPLPPPTAIPGEPSLVARDFSIEPSPVTPGAPFALRFTLVNQGNYAALGVSVSVDAASGFMPSGGQASVIVPDIPPGGTAAVTMNVVAPGDGSGMLSVPVSMAYRDQRGNNYTGQAAFSVDAQAVLSVPQLILSRYMVNPRTVTPGEAVNVQILIRNNGTGTARGVILRLGEGVLLAGEEGDSFSFGDLEAGQSRAVDLPLIASGSAEAGPQRQALSIHYIEGGEAKQIDSSITVQVVITQQPEPFILLYAYETSQPVLKPGDRFLLDLTLQNVGGGLAHNTFATFGAASSGDSGGGGAPPTNGTTFAPLGTGNTVYLDTIEAEGGTAQIQQEFIVNAGVASGIYALPLTVSYRQPDGETAQTTLNASIIVLRAPRLRVEITQLPPEIPQGEVLTFQVAVINGDDKAIDVPSVRIQPDSGDVLDGASSAPGTIAEDKDSKINAAIIVSQEGELTITVEVDYLDDFGGAQTLTSLVTVNVTEPIDYGPPPDYVEPPPPVPQEETGNNGDWLGRFIMGLLGLGS